MKRRLFILFSSWGIPFLMSAQLTNQWQNIYKAATEVTPSPAAAAMQRFDSWQMSSCTGVPDISFPLYTIRLGKLEVPITLSYHLGGLRVEDVPSWVGLGWTLDAGGQISRTVKGLADEAGLLNQGYTNEFTSSNGSTVRHTMPLPFETYNTLLDVGSGFTSMDDYLKRLKNTQLDSQGDQYSYRVGNVSGGFTYSISRQLVPTPFSDHIVTRDASNNYKVVAEDGTQYKFNVADAEYATYNSQAGFFRSVATWRLSEMISADGADTIRFNYSAALTSYTDHRSTVTISEGYETESYNYTHSKRETGSFSIFSEERLLTSITWRNGSVEFGVSAELRKDKRKYKLATITVKDKSNRQVKKASFDYGYFLSRLNPVDGVDYRLKLTAFTLYGSGTQSPERYSFVYNESSVLPPYASGTLNLHLYRGQDLWGYYNGVTTNTHLVGRIPPSSRSYAQNADRTSVESSMKACVLTRVNLPLGGYTQFETEANRDNTGKVVGGLRVKAIRMNDGANEVVHNYTYEQPVYVFEPSDEEYAYNMYVVGSSGYDVNAGTHPRTYYTEQPFSSWGNLNGSPVVYRKVTKNETGGSQSGNKTVYSYSNPVTYTYTLFGSSTHFYIPNNQYAFHNIPVNWAMGQPDKEEYYVQGISTPVKTVTYEYSTQVGNAVPVGHVVLERFLVYSNHPINPQHTYAKELYESYWVYAPSGYKKLRTKTETDYSPDTQSSVSKVTDYTYGNITSTTKRNLLLTAQSTNTSNGETLTERYTYPQDYTAAPYPAMVAKNMLAYPVETVSTRGSLPVDKVRTNYKQSWLNSQQIAPVTIEQQQAASTSYRNLLQYYSYDKYGNPTQYSEGEGGLMTVCIWGYKGTRMVGRVVAPNATTNYYATVTNLIGAANMALLDGQPTDAQVRSIFTSLRTSLPKAHITSYTSLPLVGTTSVTDPSGIITYYEYDPQGRLSAVKDHTGKAVDKYEYNYRVK